MFVKVLHLTVLLAAFPSNSVFSTDAVFLVCDLVNQYGCIHHHRLQGTSVSLSGLRRLTDVIGVNVNFYSFDFELLVLVVSTTLETFP